MAFACLGVGAQALAQTAASTAPLPSATGRPMTIDFANDPVLSLGRQHSGYEQFRDAIATAVERHPGTAESAAGEDEALAALEEARSMGLPSVDLSITSYRVISREFSNDPENILERSRPEQRTDAILTAQQTVFDFGATARRITAAGARLRGAGADLEVAADRIALGAIASWYDVFAFRSLVALSEAFVASQHDLRAAVEERIRQGVSAEGDLARVDSYIAEAQSRLARFRRLAANAEARYLEVIGSPAPRIDRAPIPAALPPTRDEVIAAAESSAAVRSADAQSDAARDEARAMRADRLPQVAVGIDAGRYGLFENPRDYDIRARVGMRYRIFGPMDARAEQGEARARQADARAQRIRVEASRDASIAWSDYNALQDQLRALEASYIANRRSRDVIVERFRVARGSLIDVVDAEDSYFQAAIAYIQGLTELDAARYVLLSRMGRLLDTLRIDTDQLRGEG